MQHNTAPSAEHVTVPKASPKLWILLSFVVATLACTIPQLLQDLSMVAATPQAAPTSSQLATPQLIDQAYTSGQISAGERILYLAYAVYDYPSLPAAFQSNVRWDGTLVVRELNMTASDPAEFCTFNPTVQRELRRLLQPSVSCPP